MATSSTFALNGGRAIIWLMLPVYCALWMNSLAEGRDIREYRPYRSTEPNCQTYIG